MTRMHTVCNRLNRPSNNGYVTHHEQIMKLLFVRSLSTHCNYNTHHRRRCFTHNNIIGRRYRILQFVSSSSDCSNDTSYYGNNNTTNYARKTRFRARVAYQGTSYHGWQLQTENRSTIQGEIESVLAIRFHNRRIPVLGAGRTDSGVHSRGQAVHFDLLPNEIPFVPPLPPNVIGEGTPIMTSNEEDDEEDKKKCIDFCNELQHSMNRMLPLDIRIFNLQLAPYTWTIYNQGTDDTACDESDVEDYTLSRQSPTSRPRARPWHAIQSAKSKWYSYRFTLGPTLWNPMERYTRTHFVHRPSFASSSSKLRPSRSAMIEPYVLTKKDIDRLQSILHLYEGTHDFKAFGGQLEQNEKRSGRTINTIRTVYKVELVKEPLKEGYNFGNDDISPSLQTKDQMGFIGEEGNYRIDFLLQGALYKMVRNMVGTAMEVWMGRLSEEQLIELLQNNEEGSKHGEENKKKLKRKDNPCKPAPPEGLTLECVYYDDQF